MEDFETRSKKLERRIEFWTIFTIVNFTIAAVLSLELVLMLIGVLCIH